MGRPTVPVSPGMRDYLKQETFCAKIWIVLGKPQLLVTLMEMKIGINPWVSILRNMATLELKESEKYHFRGTVQKKKARKVGRISKYDEHQGRIWVLLWTMWKFKQDAANIGRSWTYAELSNLPLSSYLWGAGLLKRLQVMAWGFLFVCFNFIIERIWVYELFFFPFLYFDVLNLPIHENNFYLLQHADKWDFTGKKYSHISIIMIFKGAF